jgi:L-lactate dehydrogenase complex protein LldF
MAESRYHKRQVKSALKDEQLQTALERAVTTYDKARADVMEDFDFEKSRNEVRSLKERCVAKLDKLFATFKAHAEGVSAVVHEAANGEEAAKIVIDLAKERSVKSIVKSKSMLTEEIELNPRLEKAGLTVTETDLGEWIIQLAKEKPSHFTQPAIHKTRQQVADLFSKVTGEKQDDDVRKLVDVARKRLRQAFIEADMGITGANIAIAETGGIVLVTNEGNGRLVSTLPPIHVVIVGYDKLVETMDDANEILKVLSKSSTGQKQTAYVSFITGPSRTTDIEKTLALGVHGPKELHIIFVDNGRRTMLADDDFRQALYCIKCGACLNSCPVYNSIGGHAYGNSYMGGIGSVLTAFHRDLDAAQDTLELCTGCSYCTSICPSRIDTPSMVLGLRGMAVEKSGLPITARVPMGILKNPELFRKSLTAARSLQWPFVGQDGMLKDFPISLAVGNSRKMPGVAGKFLRDMLPEESSASGKMTVSLYAGCMIDFIYPEIGRSIWNVLAKSDVKALFPKDQSCCGAPALYMGDCETARQLAIDNITALEEGSPDYIVTGCPTCAVMLKEKFKTLLEGTEWQERAEKLSEKIYDFSAFAADILQLQPEKVLEGSFTYHDPCHQVRGLGTSDRSRELLMCAGMELVEMDKPDQCCGFAGSYAIKQAGISSKILERKIKSIEDTGVKTLVTDCPGCIMQIRGGLASRGSDIKVCHSAQIIEEII